MIAAEKKESHPLTWPDDWPRTHPRDQRVMASWKRTSNQYRDALVKELTRMGAPSFVISSNVPLTQRGGLETRGLEPRDVGVAVYFSRKEKEDFTWNDILGIRDPISVTEAQIQDAFKVLAQRHHPDRGGDIAMFQKVTEARNKAMRWINRATDQNFPYVIACDSFKEVRLNMAAIVLTLKSIRQIERCGSSRLLERAFKGFAALTANAESLRNASA